MLRYLARTIGADQNWSGSPALYKRDLPLMQRYESDVLARHFQMRHLILLVPDDSLLTQQLRVCFGFAINYPP